MVASFLAVLNNITKLFRCKKDPILNRHMTVGKCAIVRSAADLL